MINTVTLLHTCKWSEVKNKRWCDDIDMIAVLVAWFGTDVANLAGVPSLIFCVTHKRSENSSRCVKININYATGKVIDCRGKFGRLLTFYNQMLRNILERKKGWCNGMTWPVVLPVTQLGTVVESW